jgi:serine/threonine protein kinase
MESSRSAGAKGSRGYLTPAQSLSGRYELLGRLGSGGMAEVYLARAVGLEGLEFEKIVVLKRVLPERVDDRRYAAMFRDEARVAATLEHPNIVHTHDIGIKDDECFFTMEYLHGEDLKAILAAANKAHEHLPLELALQIAVGCAAGLHHAHEQTDYAGRPLEIVHRDVSPSNIIVTRQSGVKLIDFGIAKAASDKEHTGVGVLKGKVAYMSPEQCRGEALDRRCDIFAMGILLYEMVTMERPFKATNVLGTVHKLLGEEPPPPHQRRHDCPLALERIVLKALEKDPTRRYQTAFEMQEELELVTRDHQLHALPGALGRYLEHLFGVKPHPWRQHAKRPPAVPRWAWTEMDSTLTSPQQKQSQRDAPMPKLPVVPMPELHRTTMPGMQAAAPLDAAVVTAKMPAAMQPVAMAPIPHVPMPSGVHAPVPLRPPTGGHAPVPLRPPTGNHAPVGSRRPTGGYVPVQLDNTYASETAAELGTLGMPPMGQGHSANRWALRHLLLGGVVGALVALAGLSLLSSHLGASTSGAAPPGSGAPATDVVPQVPGEATPTPAPPPVSVTAPAPPLEPMTPVGEAAQAAPAADATQAEALPSQPAQASSQTTAQAARLVERARTSLLTNPKQAHRDAKNAYDLRPSQTALQLMGHAACRMHDEEKARWAYRRLRSHSAQQALASSCLQLGVALE